MTSQRKNRTPYDGPPPFRSVARQTQKAVSKYFGLKTGRQWRKFRKAIARRELYILDSDWEKIRATIK